MNDQICVSMGDSWSRLKNIYIFIYNLYYIFLILLCLYYINELNCICELYVNEIFKKVVHIKLFIFDGGINRLLLKGKLKKWEDSSYVLCPNKTCKFAQSGELMMWKFWVYGI